ncbi:MAG TPA: hypothetical protein VHB21_07695, partial [Minicystis sp.]|nr:hypothetical protein [Minicystis sp.]
AAAPKALSPEDALLARVEQLAKVEFFRAAGGGPRRPRVAPVAFDLAELPRARLDAMPLVEEFRPQQKNPPGPPPKLGPIDPEIRVAPYDANERSAPGDNRNVRLSLVELTGGRALGPGLAQLGLVEQIRRSRTAVSREIVEHCGNGYGYDRWVPIRWSRVYIEQDGARVAIGDAIFDRVSCSAHVLQRADAKAAPLLPGGRMYAFVGCGESCATRASLVIVMPRANQASAASLGGDPEEEVGAFTLVDVPVEHGGGASVVAALQPSELSAWLGALVKIAPPVSGPAKVVGVEVTQSVRDRRPVAIAYAEADDEPGERRIARQIRKLSSAK